MLRRLLSLGSGLYGLIVPVAALLLWTLASRQQWLSEQTLPGPGAVWDALSSSVGSGELGAALSISLRRVFYGFALGAGLGLLLGAAMGLSRTFREYFDPSFCAAVYLPLLGWVPLLVMLLGVGEALKIVLIAKAALVPVALNTYGGVRSVPRHYFELSGVYRFSAGQRLLRVVLPAALPQIWSGLRLGLSVSFFVLVAVEFMAASEGLGYLMVSGQQLFQMNLVLAMALVIGLIGLLQDRILAGMEARLLRWRRPAFGGRS
ncbi:MAG: ABC transporter permease [Pseudoxanthomonas sp.]